MKIAPETLDAVLEKAEQKPLEVFSKWLSSQGWAAGRLPNGDLHAVTATITPEIAAFLLKHHNPRNRMLTEGNVKTIRAQMEAGEWMLTSQGISISKEGYLNDGQHRLWACVLSKVPFKTMVVFGEARHAQLVLDTGRKRRPADAISLLEMDIKNETTVAAAARLIFYYRNGLMSSKPAVTNPEVADIVKENTGLIEAAMAARKFSGKVRSSPGGATFAVFLIQSALKKATPATIAKFEEFVDRLAKGGGDRDHCLALRDGLMRGSFDRDIKGSLEQAYAQAAAIIRGWNSYLSDAHLTPRRNKKTRLLNINPWKPGDRFPVPEYR